MADVTVTIALGSILSFLVIRRLWTAGWAHTAVLSAGITSLALCKFLSWWFTPSYYSLSFNLTDPISIKLSTLFLVPAFTRLGALFYREGLVLGAPTPTSIALALTFLVLPHLFALSYNLKYWRLDALFWMLAVAFLSPLGNGASLPSEWLLASILIFAALALTKRHVELATRCDAELPAPQIAAIASPDLSVVAPLAAEAAFNVVTVLRSSFSLDAVHDLYRCPDALWLISPILMDCLSRLLCWLIGVRETMTHSFRPQGSSTASLRSARSPARKACGHIIRDGRSMALRGTCSCIAEDKDCDGDFGLGPLSHQ
ncbi:hypothetical protein [Bradyrhizobium sp. 169]|uniref:hypothetical protein n=1 Tax=Bradyrhizobium sp. 169 TaxID=2782640 RepID=UPI001FF874D4|nr:hypothetical protein [Bradyrhizobium sp. 169]MCK1587165.1 hypothetical protein [Bradyrhizobium sp. 169]